LPETFSRLTLALALLSPGLALSQAADPQIPDPKIADAPRPADAAPAATTSSTEQSEIPDVPGLSADLHGINAGITMSSLHDSITGWATLSTPAVGYSLNEHFNVDATIPIYLYRLAESRLPRPNPNAELIIQRAEIGDVVIGLHSAFSPRLFDYQLTGTVAAPTGDREYGLTSGRVTFDVTNHFEHTFNRLTPTLEMGVGDSSTLVNQLVTKNYTSLGPLAHFQTGLSVQLPFGATFESDAYEQLPIGDQKTYGPSRRGRATVVTGHNISEDNGFTNSFDLPLDRHTTFSAYYNRSLRIHNDTVAVGVTYVLRPAPLPEIPDTSLDELFK
jgi:hypothetical protein